VRGAEINYVTMVSDGRKTPVTQLPFSEKDLIQGLEDGRIAISLEDALNDCDKSEIELFDYEETE